MIEKYFLFFFVLIFFYYIYFNLNYNLFEIIIVVSVATVIFILLDKYTKKNITPFVNLKPCIKNIQDKYKLILDTKFTRNGHIVLK